MSDYLEQQSKKDRKTALIALAAIWFVSTLIFGSAEAFSLTGCKGTIRPVHFLSPGYLLGCALWTPVGEKIYGDGK